MSKIGHVALMAATLVVAGLSVPVAGLGQNLWGPSQQITVFDRTGNVLSTLGEPSMYRDPVFSPDRTRVAAMRFWNIWVFDVATGIGAQIASGSSPVWSPDGSQIAYTADRDSYVGVYRKSSDGEGPEELLYEHPGGEITLTDWSLDGRFLSFYEADLSGGSLYLLPLGIDRQPIEVARSEFLILGARLSPDNRYLAYRSDETGRNEIFVRSVEHLTNRSPVDDASSASVRTWQVSREGALGMASWRRDGGELYFLGADRSVMAVEVNTVGGFESRALTEMFHAPDGIPQTEDPTGMGQVILDQIGGVSRDGEQIVLAVPPSQQLRQITVFDREGNIVNQVAEPGLYSQPAVSPDGSRVAVLTGDRDIWTFDILSGQGVPATLDHYVDSPPVWLPDGHRVAYVATGRSETAVYATSWNGEGPAQLLLHYPPGVPLGLDDFSADGRFLSIDGGDIVLVVPLEGTDPSSQDAIEFIREEFEAGLGRFSPDGRFLAYRSNESGRFEVHVQRFDDYSGQPDGDEWQISQEGTIGGISWRGDGQELFYLAEDEKTMEVKLMTVDVATARGFQAGTPRVLFRLPGTVRGSEGQWSGLWKNFSPDGQRFVVAMPVP